MSAFHIQPDMVFPSTKMGAVNKLITEGNLTRLINTLIDSDKYIIPSEGVNFLNSEYINGNTLVPLPVDTNENLEFAIHGYYFNLGSIANVISTVNSQAGKPSTYKVVAQILVDTTVDNYPELYGETDSAKTATVSGSFTIGTAELDSNYRDKSISRITTTVNSQTYVLSYRGSDYVLTSSDLVSGTQFTSYTIEYYEYSNFINLYIMNIGPDEPEPPETPVGKTIVAYNLDLLYYIGTFYFPLSSFVKFDSQSISHIDGGELTYSS